MDCTLDSINRSLNSAAEPNALVWSEPNCGGSQHSVPVGNYTLLANYKIGNDTISGLWVPPNMKLVVYDNINFTEPLGSYQAGFYKNLDNPRLASGNRQIASMQLVRQRDWSDHLALCCTGSDQVTPDQCGEFWGKGKLTNGVCDAVMERYCDPYGPNAADEKCSCYGPPPLSTDTPDVKLLKALPVCWSATCAAKGYVPSNMKGAKCPDVKVCIQNFAIPGSNNIATDNTNLQDCSSKYAVSTGPTSGTQPTGGTQPTTQPDFPSIFPPAKPETSSNTTLIILLIFLVLVMNIYLIMGSRAKDNQSDDENN